MTIGPTTPQTVTSSVGSFVVSASITGRSDGEFDVDASISEIKTNVASIPVVLTFSTRTASVAGTHLPTTDTAIFRRYVEDDGMLSLGCEVDLTTYESMAHMIYADGIEADGAAVESFAIEAASLVRELIEVNPRIVQMLDIALARATGEALRLISAEQRNRADHLSQSAEWYAHDAGEIGPERGYAPPF